MSADARGTRPRQFSGRENGRERGFLWVGEGVFMVRSRGLLEKTTCGFAKSHLWFYEKSPVVF